MKAASLIILLATASLATAGQKKKEEALNRDTTPFWISDTIDGMCLGADGFGECGPENLWILASTSPKKKTIAFVSMFAPEADLMCLGSSGWMFSSRRRVGVSKCGSSNAKNMELASLSVQGDPGFLLSQGSKNCLARGQGRLRNSADMQLCTKGTPLNIVEAPVHNAGMHITTVDGYCFDGSKFRICNDGDPTLRWGIGMDFRKTEPSRNVFHFFDREKCAVREGETVKKGDCKSKGAARWGWRNGKLTQGDTHCLGRAPNNVAVFVPCLEGHEHVSFANPAISPALSPASGEREKSATRKAPPRKFQV